MVTHVLLVQVPFNCSPLKSDQQLISYYNINGLLRAEVMRINTIVSYEL